VAPVVAAAATPPANAMPPPLPAARRPWSRRWYVRTALLIVGLAIIGNELALSSRARRLAADASAAELGTVGDLRKRYEAKRAAEAQQEFTDAVAAFREAAELRPDWPDPFLGLMRTFIYGLEDVDRGADALKQAQRLGYTAGDRETVQIADGYRARGDAFARTARTLADMPQEHEYLARAADAYRQAMDLYSKATGYADVPRILRSVHHALDQ